MARGREDGGHNGCGLVGADEGSRDVVDEPGLCVEGVGGEEGVA